LEEREEEEDILKRKRSEEYTIGPGAPTLFVILNISFSEIWIPSVK
jgi:hypothetical protein